MAKGPPKKNKKKRKKGKKKKIGDERDEARTLNRKGGRTFNVLERVLNTCEYFKRGVGSVNALILWRGGYMEIDTAQYTVLGF